MPPKGESPATGIARPPLYKSNSAIKTSTRHPNAPTRRGLSAREAGGRPAESFSNPRRRTGAVAAPVARIGERRGLEHISVELARLIEETVVRASGGLLGELGSDSSSRSE